MRRDRLKLLLGLALTAITLVAYAPVAQNDFVSLDDPLYLTDNRMVKGGLTSDGVLWAWTTFDASNWHPLTWLSLQLDAQLFGVNPAAFHLVNLLLHTANVLLLFAVLCRMTGAAWRSATVAAFFAVHPLHVESVAWVTERKDVLSVCFGLLALLAYARYAARPGPGRYLLVVLAFLLSLLAKPTLVTLPCALLLLDFWPLRRLRLARWEAAAPIKEDIFPEPRFAPASLGGLLLEKVPLFALSAFSSWMTLMAQTQAVATLTTLPLALRLQNALLAYETYVVKTLWPVRLAVFYPHSMAALPVWQVAAAGLLLAAITAFALLQARRRPYLLVGWLWFLGTLVPVIGLVQVGDQALADRYTYIPHIGLFVMLVWGLADLLEAWRCPMPVRALLAAASLAACAVLTWVQVGYWRDSITLWEHTLQVTTQNYRAHANLGSTLADQGKYREATPHLRAALAINDRDPELHLLLGETLLNQNRAEEAIKPLRAALAKVPAFGRAHFRLALALLRLGKLDEGREHLVRAVRFKPDLADAQNTLGWLYLQEEDYAAAPERFRAALHFNPQLGRAHQGLGLVSLRQGKVSDAVQHYTQAVAIDDHSAEAHNGLGLALAAQGDWQQARAHFEQAVQLNGASAEYRRNLALALHELGRTGDAEVEYGEALRRDPGWPQRVACTAWILATHPDEHRRCGPEAVRLARQACQATHRQQAEFLDVLAAAYAETGQFDEAVRAAEQAQVQAQAAGQAQRAGQIQERLRLYHERRPFRDGKETEAK